MSPPRRLALFGAARYPLSMHPRAILLLLPLLLTQCAAPAPAQTHTDEVSLADVLDVLVVDRTLLAVDARSGGQRALDLRLNEQVAWTGARGRVGIALTDQRILGARAGAGSWQSEDRHRGEVLPAHALLGERVALVLTSLRALGYDGGSGNFVETRFGVRERFHTARVGENVGVVVTDRRVLGLSPLVGGFFEAKLDLNERVESVEAQANLATVTTNRRLLIFRAPSGSWEERRRALR